MPTKKLLILFGGVSICMVVIVYQGLSLEYALIAILILLLLSLIDLLFSPRRNELKLIRTMPNEMERGIPYSVNIEVKNASRYSFFYKIIDGIPPSFNSPFPLTGKIRNHANTQLSYETTANVRGKYEIKKLYVRYSSFLRLWEKQLTVELANEVKVIPDLTETKHYLENAQSFLLYDGVKIRKQKSGIGEFAKIRSYVVGDDPRKINWRQTAKLQQLMTNEFEPEHGKYVTILIDCGRMMVAELKKGNRLEKVLEAAITVIAAALKKGDHVSVLAFSKDVKVFVPAAKGMAHLQTILQAIYHLEVDAVESNYGTVLSYLETMQKKRSLLLLFSDIGTFLHEESALMYLKRLRQRHLFLMIGIEDATLAKRINEEIDNVQNTMEKSMAMQQMLIKNRERKKWEKQGLQMIEAREETLATAAVSYYIDIMNRNIL